VAQRPRGRRLSEHDIAHYQRVVVALAETIRIMKEIDKVMSSTVAGRQAFQAGGEARTRNLPCGRWQRSGSTPTKRGRTNGVVCPAGSSPSTAQTESPPRARSHPTQ